MSSAVELRQWLNRTDKDFITNLGFGIKVWQSIEFVLITKHEIITEEFCANLPKWRKEAKRSAIDYAAAWPMINEFLALKYTAGAISSSVKELLINTLHKEAHKTLANPETAVFTGLQCTLHNAAMQNYYRSNPDAYARFVGTNIRYANALVARESAVWLQISQEPIKALLTAIKLYAKHTPFLDQFQATFSTDVYAHFVELIISLRHRKHDQTAEFFAIVQELYFSNDTATAELKQCLSGEKSDSRFEAVLRGPVHAFLMLVEVILLNFRHDTDLPVLLHKFMFERYDGKTLTTATYYLQLLRKHDISMSVCMEPGKALMFVGTQVQELIEAQYETNLCGSLRLLITGLELNPMMMEHTIFTVLAKCMLTRKDDESSELHLQCMCLVIDIYRRLSRAEKFVSQLIRALWQRLGSMKLSKKTKRKSVAASDGTPRKKAIGLDGEPTVNGDESVCDYLTMLLEAFTKQNHLVSGETAATDVWSDITFAWPSQLGDVFSKFISGLVSKPSLVVWKTLIFALTDFIRLVRDGNTDENTVFIVELTSAIMCQYFDGCRLAEHADKSWDLIEANRRLTCAMLKEFGAAILSQEHNIRTMNAFLKVCYNVGAFDLLCWFYCPDSMIGENAQVAELQAIDGAKLADTIHGYLIDQEWTLIEQRITNFGRIDCKANLNRLNLQRLKAATLFRSCANPTICVQNHLLSSTMTDLEQVSGILCDTDNSSLFVQSLGRQEMIEIGKLLLDAEQPQELTANVWHRKEFAEILYVLSIKRLTEAFTSKRSILSDIDSDSLLIGDGLLAGSTSIVKALLAHLDASEKVKIKKFSKPIVLLWVEFMTALPVHFIVSERKDVLVLIAMALYCNVLATEDAQLTRATHSLVKAFFYFGDAPNVFAHLSIGHVAKIFDCARGEGKEIWEIICVNATKQMTSSLNADAFEKLLQMLSDCNIDDSILDVCLVHVRHLAKEKRCKDHYKKYSTALLDKIGEYFAGIGAKKIESKFIDRTLSGFVAVIAPTLAKFNDVDDNQATLLRTIFKTYLKESINCNEPDSIALLGLALSHKSALLIDDEAMRMTVDQFWSDLMARLKCSPAGGLEHLETFLKTILNSKTDLEFVELLIDEKTNDMNIVPNFCAFQHLLLANIAKCQLNKTKGSIFNEFCKQLSFRIVLSLRHHSPDASIVANMDALLKLLECHRLICTNVQLPVSTELVDDILALLAEINVKKFQATASNRSAFVALHSGMSDVCQALVNHRHLHLGNRVAQFVVIVRDLLQAVCWFRGAKHDGSLENGEVIMLAELSHKMENVLKSFVKHTKIMKRVAPYLLISIMDLMISNERPTTLFPKIKTHFEYICYDLISACDHRVEGFIMRNCNEASKQLYEQFMKDFNKYHKFKGKV